MGKLIQFRPRKVGYKLKPPNSKCPICKGLGYIAREEGVDLAVPSIIICDCMKGK